MVERNLIRYGSKRTEKIITISRKRRIALRCLVQVDGLEAEMFQFRFSFRLIVEFHGVELRFQFTIDWKVLC